MFKNKKYIALAALLSIVLFVLLYTIISQGYFYSKGIELNEGGSKEYVSPGKLEYCQSSDDGSWLVYMKTGQCILSYLDHNGDKSWQNVYNEPNIIISSSPQYTVIAQADDNEIKIINKEGKRIYKFSAKGNTLLCNINNQNIITVVSDIMGTENDDGYSTNIATYELENNQLNKILEKDYREVEFIEAKSFENGVIALGYRLSQQDKGQYFYIINSNSEQIFSKKLSDDFSNIDVSPNGENVIWTEGKNLFKYNISSNKATQYKIDSSQACGFLSDNELYTVRKSYLPLLGHRTIISVKNLAGKRISKAGLAGTLKKLDLVKKDSLVVTTDKGTYEVSSKRGNWYVKNNNLLQSAVTDNTIYTINQDNKIVWYKRP